MNRHATIISVVISLLMSSRGADGIIPSKGLEAMFTLTVVDEIGNPVQNATVESTFALFGEKHLKTIKSETGPDGTTIARGRAIERVVFSVGKDSFYPSRVEVPLLKSPMEVNQPSIDAGKWLPWNQPIRIELLRNDAIMHTRLRHVAFPIPAFGKTYGMDFMEGLVFELSANTNKLVADFLLKLEDNTPCGDHPTGENCRAYSLSITSGREGNRVRLQKQNGQSRYLFPTHLAPDGWTNGLCFAYSDVGGKVFSTFPDRGYRGYRNSVLVPGERECVVFAFNRADKESNGIVHYAAVAPRFEVSSTNILNVVWSTSSVSNGIFAAHATGF